ncbi:hypothetical protein E2C01_061689 [Portunus trituberculatus]|uniref:Uncharacterized protein n=1 Tax=Portunus trituberculatus TaxID=210409 RepID=A0A5B7H8U9_PORTR|nr:hypothetical protein [Portunus trituberculatus]
MSNRVQWSTRTSIYGKTGFTSFKPCASTSQDFTKVLALVSALVYCYFIPLHYHLDDWLVSAPSEASCIENTRALLLLCTRLGIQLLEVMAEESKLDQLVAGARRRRQLDHRQLVEHLLQERRVLRAKLMNQHQLHNQEELAYNQLRKSILEEEEKQLLLKYAPHLMPYFSPELHARLRQLL